MLTLEKQRILLVGGTSGIGLATAALAREMGADVTVAGRSQAKIDAAIRDYGVQGRPIEVTSDESVEGFFRGDGDYDHIVVTAAAFRVAPVRDVSVETSKATFESKFWGSVRIAKWGRIAPTGSLTLVSGVASVRPVYGMAMLAAATSGLEALTRGLAIELSPVRVNCVSPGMVDTPMLRAAAPVDIDEVAARKLLVGRMGRPEEVALQLLACVCNAYMTGSVIYLDGGERPNSR